MNDISDENCSTLRYHNIPVLFILEGKKIYNLPLAEPLESCEQAIRGGIFEHFDDRFVSLIWDGQQSKMGLSSSELMTVVNVKKNPTPCLKKTQPTHGNAGKNQL